jgi:tRNA A37 methylthiotransferase MiaB
MCNFLKEAKLTNCGFFAYSREPDTAAYSMKGQIPYAEKKKRVKALYAVQMEVSREFLSGFVGKKLQVLCDGIDYDNNCFVGRAYFNAPDIDGKVYFNANEAVQGQYYDIIVTDFGDYDLFGKTEDFVDE